MLYLDHPFHLNRGIGDLGVSSKAWVSFDSLLLRYAKALLKTACGSLNRIHLIHKISFTIMVINYIHTYNN